MSTALERKWFEAVASLECCVLCGRHGVQVAHSNEDRGMSQKSKPWNTAALCPTCHHECDNGKGLTQAERRAQMDRAIKRTHDRLIDSGKLKLS
jgi:5-methylcytosine-specific restriction endonuclease McrA